MAAPSGNSSMDIQRYMRAAGDAMRMGDMAHACHIGMEAVSRGLENEQLLTLAAYASINAGNDTKALELALRARSLAPRSLDVLTALAMCQQRNGLFGEAAGTCDAALKLSPGNARLRFNKACALEAMSEIAKASREFERVLDAEPRNAEALAHLANLAAQRGDAQAARDYAVRALQIDPRQSAATLALATADVEDGKFEDALARVKPLLADTSPVNRSIAQGLAGDALDGLDRIEEAFRAYTASKETLKAFYQPVYEAAGTERALARVNRLEQYFRDAPEDAWQAHGGGAPQSAVKEHVFLIGFPRSGTTLLEQILASHRDVVSMEERDCLIDAEKEFLTPDGLDRLGGIGSGDLAAARQSYWRRVEEAGITLSAPVFVDKMPLNTVLLCLVAKLFPQAKILFALRDPRDVVLSCFRRRFVMTAQMYELITLEGAAKYYDAVMQLAERYREKLGLNIHELRYETMVADLETQVRAVCAFMGIEWDGAMRDFASRARKRGIDTPSAAQVSRGLYTQGVGQWQRYAAQLAPVMPLLGPWLTRYGYTE
ncbi:MAG: sulfotransferase [Proteobacteria bacterium]|nr:sulfotransferase [Pseudomonadota bacterium]